MISIHLKAVETNIQLEAAVAATSEVARLWETLPIASWVLGPYENPCIDVIFWETGDIKTHDFDGFRNVTLLIHQIDIVGLYQCLYIREFPKTTFMCPVVFFVATFESTILWLLKFTEYFYDIYSELSLWWPFSNALVFLKQLFITPKLVTQGKESSITIKETDFPAVLKPEWIRFIHTHWTIESTMDTLADKFAIWQIIMDWPHIGNT
jgi:hypothetical protein